jgi:hypothetical protein
MINGTPRDRSSWPLRRPSYVQRNLVGSVVIVTDAISIVFDCAGCNEKNIAVPKSCAVLDEIFGAIGIIG